jgi:putative transposase
VTILGLSRWTGTGGSYRTIQRFFHTPLPWAAILWVFVRTQMLTPGDDVLLGGDEGVVTKAGTETYGVDRFFSRIVGQPVPGVSLFTLALVSRSQRQAFPVQVEQVLREPAASPPPTLPAAKRKPGRPKGRSTQTKADAPLNAEHARLSTMIAALLARLRPYFTVTYLVLDGQFGNHNAVLLARRLGLLLISKLRSDSARYYPYDGPYAGHGPRRIYGARIDPTATPERFLKQTTVEGDIETRISQVEARHKTFDQPLNVVVIVKRHQTTGKQAHIAILHRLLNPGD